MSKYPEEQVLEQLMEEGTFDELRHKIVQELKRKEDLKVFTEEKVREELQKDELAKDIARLQSAHESSSARAKIQSDVLAKLRDRLQGIIMTEISKSAWEIMCGETDLAHEIEAKVHGTCDTLFGTLPEAKGAMQ
mmetsp:Transcript_32470/g.92016  ORF Transcript_32470/g.92016 Transcript_32470/m.92016 type:complete len:135 (+) Transcript_32470:356-760(+)